MHFWFNVHDSHGFSVDFLGCSPHIRTVCSIRIVEAGHCQASQDNADIRSLNRNLTVAPEGTASIVFIDVLSLCKPTTDQ